MLPTPMSATVVPSSPRPIGDPKTPLRTFSAACGNLRARQSISQTACSATDMALPAPSRPGTLAT